MPIHEALGLLSRLGIIGANDWPEPDEMTGFSDYVGTIFGHDAAPSDQAGAQYSPTEDPEITALRERQKRNLIATMMLSHGTPMLLSGDEFGHIQNGSNNAYAQDNETSWLNWLDIGSQAEPCENSHAR